jgi:hypothetical protein
MEKRKQMELEILEYRAVISDLYNNGIFIVSRRSLSRD